MGVSTPDELEVLRVLVEAHAQPHSNTRKREPIMYLRHMGGATVHHHALKDRPDGVDEALPEELAAEGLITIDYPRQDQWSVTPTAKGRRVVNENQRLMEAEAVADVAPLQDALARQAETENPLAWAAVRPVRAALRDYWQRGGFSQHGVQLFALVNALPAARQPLFAATVQALVEGGYLDPVGAIRLTVTKADEPVGEMPGEVKLTEKARTILEGWPGASPDEMVQNFLAVLTAAAAQEQDPVRRRRFERLAETIREVGVGITSEVIAKVLTGGGLN